MLLIRDLFLAAFLITVVYSIPGSSHHHVHHRIHVPQKIKTVYHTKIVKVPEHHHHFHEKEKIIIQKEPPKIEHHPIIIKEKDHHDWSSSHHDDWSGLESSDFLKKKRNAPQHSQEIHNRKVKKWRAQHHPHKFHRP